MTHVTDQCFPAGSSKISWNELGARLPYWGASHNEVLLDHLYITAAEAAEILGVSLEEFQNLDRKPTHLEFGGDIGVRYWRDWTEAWRDGRLIPPGWEDYMQRGLD